MDKKNICTIEEWSVNWDATGNSLLCTHEYIHKTLTITTIYGAVQRVIKLYSDHFPKDLTLKRIQYELFKHVMYVQECCATFCSVMQISNDIDIADHLLPASYLIYYNTYYNCFKSRIKSTYLAYTFAEAIAQLCMNNQVHLEIIDYLQNKSATFSSSHFSPDTHFDSIINNITPDILDEAIEYCNSQNPDPSSDINNDEYWKHSVKKSYPINKVVFDAVYYYFSRKFISLHTFSLNTICIDDCSWLNSLIEALIAKYGKIASFDTKINEHPYKLNNTMLIDLECIDTVKIYNKPYMRSATSLPSEDTVGINYKPYHKKLTLHTYLCENCFFDTNGNWYQFNSDGKLHDDVYFHYTRLPNYMCQNPLFVIGMAAESKTKELINKEVKAIKDNLKYICKISSTRIKNLASYNTMFYMFGRFSYWLDYLVQYPECKFHILQIDDKNASTTQKTNPFAMVAFYSPSLPGIFIKCFNNTSYVKILPLLDEFIKQHMIVIDYSQEKLLIRKKVMQAFDAIDALWLEF